MKYFLFFFVFAMIAKDVIPIGDVYVMRGTIQSAALVAGIAAIFMGLNLKYFVRNWLLFFYLLIVLISSSISALRGYSILQSLSLIGPILFFIGYNRGSENSIKKNNVIVIRTYVVLYTLTCVASLTFWIINPKSMTEVLWNNEIRFTGLFNTPGMMGTASGLLLGASLLLRIALPIRVISIVASAACLYLTLSRTFVIAAVVGIELTAWLYFPRFRKHVLFVTIVLSVVLAALFAHYYADSSKNKDIDKIVRGDSISNLSGRTSMWQTVLEKRKESLFSGEGFAAGGLLLLEKDSGLLNEASVADPRLIGRTTLHSGYIQSLADLGWIGACVYTLNIIASIVLIFIKDKKRIFPIEFYTLIFLAISNSGESIIYTAANFPTVLFWYMCAFSNNFSQTALTKNRKQ